MYTGKVKKQQVIYLPEEILNLKKECNLYGFYIKQSDTFNIIGTSKNTGASLLGKITFENTQTKKLLGVIKEDGIDFFYKKRKYKIETYNHYADSFSRNSGILETDFMKEKTAVLIGLGSVGSYIALELARSGVHKFLLIDNDVLKYHNLSRHQCGITDIGKYKVDAVKSRILDINPNAVVGVEVNVIEYISQAVLDKYLKKKDAIIIGGGDNRKSDAYANRIAAIYKVPFLSIGLWERASVGEIFYWLPDKNMPCAYCALGEGELSKRENVNNHHVYSNQEDFSKIQFQPGISVDITFVSAIAIKLVLDILNMTNPKYIIKVLNHLTQYTLVCNTNNPLAGGDDVEIFTYPLQITSSLQVCFKKSCGNKCKLEAD